MLVLGDATDAASWQGDWQRCFDALHGPAGPRSVAPIDDLLTISLGHGGLVDVFAVDGSLVLLEIACIADELDLTPSELREHTDVLTYVSEPFDAAVPVGAVTVRSGVMAVLPSTLAGDGADTVLHPGLGAAEFEPDPHGADSGVVIRVVPGRYEFVREEPRELPWGDAARAILRKA